jgi:CheY-like chemotaxis protein
MCSIGTIVLKNDELNELKGHFLASLNHEIRTPLSGILGMTDLLLETPLTEDQREYVDATRGCAENLLEILNVTLEFSALSANHIRPDESEFSLRETLQSVAAEFDAKARVKGLRLICSFDRNVPDAVIGDGLRLRQMLRHLVSNAVKFTNQGEIEIGARAGNTVESSVPLTFTVRDTGIGIPPDQVTSIFEGFRQLETGLGRAYSGLGLGLAVTQKLASLLQGSITVESEVGRGSKFVVRLPMRVPADAVQRQDAVNFRGRILVADDNAIAQTIARHTLRRQDYEVACVGDGLSAIEAARRERFDLILMDLQMPGLDGFQTAESIRKLDGYRETPIVAVTANCSPDYRERALKYGMQDFLSKPVATVDLIETVEKYLHPASLPL